MKAYAFAPGNKPASQPWYFADGKERIRRPAFYAYGGFSNPSLFRKMVGGVWTYWRRT